MAADDEQQTDENNEAEEKPSGGKKKLILLIVLGLILVGASVGGTIVALKFLSPPPAPAEEEEIAEEAVEAPPKPAIYYPLKPEYILNVDARGRRRYMRLDITVLTRDDTVIAAIDTHRASIDNVINLVAGGQIFEEIQTPEGKEFLRLQLLQEIQVVLKNEIGHEGIEQVLFTNFVMQ